MASKVLQLVAKKEDVASLLWVPYAGRVFDFHRIGWFLFSKNTIFTKQAQSSTQQCLDPSSLVSISSVSCSLRDAISLVSKSVIIRLSRISLLHVSRLSTGKRWRTLTSHGLYTRFSLIDLFSQCLHAPYKASRVLGIRISWRKRCDDLQIF